MEECETTEPQYTIVDSNTNEEDSSFTLEHPDDICFKEETLSNSDNLDESGVESATGDVTEAELLELGFTSDYFDYAGENVSFLQLGDLDLTTEQAQETLKYFSEYRISSYLSLLRNSFIWYCLEFEKNTDQGLLHGLYYHHNGLCNAPYLRWSPILKFISRTFLFLFFFFYCMNLSTCCQLKISVCI